MTTQARKRCCNQDAPLINPLWKRDALFASAEVTAEKKRSQRKDAAKEDNLGWGPSANFSDAVHAEAAFAAIQNVDFGGGARIDLCLSAKS